MNHALPSEDHGICIGKNRGGLGDAVKISGIFQSVFFMLLSPDIVSLDFFNFQKGFSKYVPKIFKYILASRSKSF